MVKIDILFFRSEKTHDSVSVSLLRKAIKDNKISSYASLILIYNQSLEIRLN